jgi:glycosyltransferase involved in cell wall biosynthesis
MQVALNGWFWSQPNTGSGQYIRRLTAALRKVQPDLRLTLIVPAHAADPDGVPEGVEVLRADGRKGRVGKVLFEQRGVPAAAARSGADLLHVPYWAPPLSSPVPLITSILDVIPLALPEYAAGFPNRLYTSLVTAAARGAAHVLTLSAAAKADILKHIGGIAPDAITATHLAVDDAYHPRLGRENDAAVRAKYDLPDQFVFYMGGFDRRKNVQALMQAYTYLQKAEGDRVPLVIAGREPQWGTSVFPDLRAYAQEVGIADNVRWLGYVEEAEKPSLYRLASVTAYPSLYEGFGLPVLEAMACGTPVIALDIPVMAEVAGDGAYLVKDARAMGGALIALLIQEPLRETMINQGLARATAFSWRKTARETLAVYERVMKEAKGGIR